MVRGGTPGRALTSRSENDRVGSSLGKAATPLHERAKRGIGRRRAGALGIEPLEERLLLSAALSPAPKVPLPESAVVSPGQTAHTQLTDQSATAIAPPGRTADGRDATDDTTESYPTPAANGTPVVAGQPYHDPTPNDAHSESDEAYPDEAYPAAPAGGPKPPAYVQTPAPPQALAPVAASLLQPPNPEAAAKPPATPDRPPPTVPASPLPATAGPSAGRTAEPPPPAAHVHREPTPGTLPAPRASSPGTADPPETDEHVEDTAGAAAPSAAGDRFGTWVQHGAVLAGMPALDLAALQRGVQQFFARIDRLGEDLAGPRLTVRLAPWVVAVAAANAAYELVRWQRQTRQRAAAAELAIPSPAEEP
jgi:hypothetical protein